MEDSADRGDGNDQLQEERKYIYFHKRLGSKHMNTGKSHRSVQQRLI